MGIRNGMKKIAQYIGLGIIGGIALIRTANAQVHTQEKPPTEITQKGDNITIPEEKLEEFLKTYKPTKNNILQKQTGSYVKDGNVTSALTQEPIEGIEAFLITYNLGPKDTIGPTSTNTQGYYTFTITGIKDQKETKNIGQIEYFGGKARITTQIEEKIKITKYNILGEEIGILTNKEILGTETIDLKLQTGETITKIEINGKTYTNIHISDGKNHYVRKGKNTISIEKTTEENNKGLNNTLEKITGELSIGRSFKDPSNQYHGYMHGQVEPFAETKKEDFTLIPRINLENQITDPEYTTIPTVRTLRDLLWYSRRVQGEWNNNGNANVLWPIKLHIDTTNAPPGWKEEIRSVIQHYQDSLGIHPDSLIKENPVNTEPAYSNGFSAINIKYTDSTELGNAYGVLHRIISSRYASYIGGTIYINVSKTTNKEDAGMIIAKQLQKYITQTGDRIKHPKYLGNTTNLELGTTRRPNNDEKKWMKISRYSSKPFYINGIRQ